MGQLQWVALEIGVHFSLKAVVNILAESTR